MKPQFDQKLVSSFYLWFENKLLHDSVGAYQTGVANTYQYIDAFDIPSNFYAYQGQYRQLVADYDVSVPNSGVFVGGSFISGGQPNLYVDYNNGRVIVPTTSGKSLNITSVSTVKEVNTYLTNDSPEQILLESDFFIEGDTVPKASKSAQKLDEKSYWLPACFVFPATSDNEEFAFGGEEETQTRIRVMILSHNNYVMDAVLSVFRDQARTCLPLIDFEDFPYGAFFSVKNHPYRYSVLSSQATEKAFIQSVKASRIGKTSEKEKVDKKFQIGFLDFDISTYRFPRA